VVRITGGGGTRRAIGLLLGFGLAAATVLVLSSPPAAACSCAGFTDQMSFERADVVFVGEVQGVDRTGVIASSSDPAVWTFSVDEVFKGDAAATQGLVTATSGASCGLELPTSETVVVFARHEPGNFEPAVDWDTLHGSLCDGSRAVADPLPAAVFGSARAPTDGSAGLPPVRSTLTSPRTLTTVAIGVVLFAVTATVLVLVRRRRSGTRS
jgi:hypothetical protein